MDTHPDNDTMIPLDGNAVGGLLRELFVYDVTGATMICAGCGAAASIGEVRVYGWPMGAIFRCVHCDMPVMRLVRTSSGLWLDMRGARSLHVGSAP